MKSTHGKQGNNGGFTIVELLLATTVFSVILLVALGSFLEVGRLFYKGVSLTATQNVATQVLNDLSSNMQSASTYSGVTPSTSGGYGYFCIGSTRYTFTTAKLSGGTQYVGTPASSSGENYNTGANGGSFGLLKDTFPGNSSCPAPCYSSCTSGQAALSSSSVEMLGDQMRLASIAITQPSASTAPNLYNIEMVVVYGDSSVLNFANPAQPTCIGNSESQAFCSVVNLSTTVFQGAQT